MKAIILAAGMGTRLGKYTENLPKCMLEFEGKTLIQRQVDTLRDAGIEDIIIIKGFNQEKIQIEVDRLAAENNRLAKNIDEMSDTVQDLKDVEDALEVITKTQFLKSTVRPWPSVSRPSSKTCRRMLKTSGCAFSISSSRMSE